MKFAETQLTSRAVAMLNQVKIVKFGSTTAVARYKSIFFIRTNSAVRTIHSADCLTLAWR